MDKVSIIMTTYNSIEHIRDTLESVRMQDYPAIEVVIQDGGSTDGTLDVIREFAEKSDIEVVWNSEPDKGIYDAMNKGFWRSSGSIVVFFNDMYCRTDAIRKCIELMKRECTVGVHADLIYADGEKVIRRWKMGKGTISQGWMPGHPTLFLKREIYEKYGLYKTDYRVSADYEFMVRILKDKAVTLSYLPETIIQMYYGGTSTKGIGGYLISLFEGHRALKENRVKRAWLIDLKRTLRVFRQF